MPCKKINSLLVNVDIPIDTKRLVRIKVSMYDWPRKIVNPFGCFTGAGLRRTGFDLARLRTSPPCCRVRNAWSQQHRSRRWRRCRGRVSGPPGWAKGGLKLGDVKQRDDLKYTPNVSIYTIHGSYGRYYTWMYLTMWGPRSESLSWCT